MPLHTQLGSQRGPCGWSGGIMCYKLWRISQLQTPNTVLQSPLCVLLGSAVIKVIPQVSSSTVLPHSCASLSPVPPIPDPLAPLGSGGGEGEVGIACPLAADSHAPFLCPQFPVLQSCVLSRQTEFCPVWVSSSRHCSSYWVFMVTCAQSL